MATSPDQLLEQAIVALDDGDIATAQKHLARLLQQDSANERAWLLMAEAQADPERKRFCVDKALSLNPNNLMALQMRDELAPKAELEPKSEVEMPPPAPATFSPPQPAPAAAPSYAEPLAEPASLPSTRGLTSDPAFLRKELERAVALIESGKRDDGTDILEQILSVDPDNESALLWMAASTRTTELKLDYIQRALAVNPKSKLGRKMLEEVARQPDFKPDKYAATEAVAASRDGQSYDWAEAWWLALTSPTPRTYDNLLADPNAGAVRGMIWIAGVTLFSGLFTLLAQQMVSILTGSPAPVALPEVEGVNSLAVFGITLLCSAPIAALLGVISLVIAAGLFNFCGRVLGGRGSFGEQIFALAAFTAPLSLVTSLLAVLSSIAGVLGNLASLVVSCLSLPLGVYTFYLNVVAMKAVQRFGWGRALVAVLLPAVFGCALFACLTYVVLSTLDLSAVPGLENVLPTLPTLTP